MKKLLLTLLPVMALSFVLTAQDTLLVEDFDGGIPDTWTTEGDNGEVWVWSEDGTPVELLYQDTLYEATFAGNSGAIESSTATNGAALFNSDAYDSAEEATPGSGPILSPHYSTLTSPVFDCSGYETVTLKFNQYYRNFDSEISYEISVDSGQTWSADTLSEKVVTNLSTSPSTVVIEDITDVAAGEETVQIRFVFAGDYYFWLVDDITVVGDITKEVGVPEFFFFSAQDYQRPELTPADTMFFQTSVANYSAEPVENLVLRARVIRDEGDQIATIYDDSTVVESFPGLTEDTITLDGFFVPSVEDLELGEYTLVYDVYPQDRNDYDDVNNQAVEGFIVGGSAFSKTRGAITNRGYGGQFDYEIGNVFEIGTAPVMGGDTTGFLATTVTTAVSVNPAESIGGENVTAFLYKVNDFVSQDWSNFPPTPKDDPEEAGARSIGFAQIEFPNEYENDAPVTGELLDLATGESGVLLEPNSQYILTVSYVDAANVAFQAGDSRINYTNNLGSMLWFPPEESWFLNSFGSTVDFMPFIELGTELVIVDQDEVALPEASMNIFPNPVRSGENLNVAIDLETPQEAAVILAHIDGRIISNQELDMVQKETVQLETQNLAAGQYFVRLSTNEGTRTLKFSVVR